MASGCGLSGATTGVQNLTIQIAAQERSYVLFVPATYNANSALPLVFAWHGLGGSGTLARQYFGVERASANSAIFVYPTGLADSSGKAAWTLTKDGVDVQLFDALRADVAAKYCVDLARVYSTGHSYGAMMTNALGCYRSNVLRGIAPVAGMPPFGRPTCTGAVAAWISHGDNDATVDFTTGGVASRDLWIGLNGCSTTIAPEATAPSPCVAYQGCSSGHPVNWCVHQDDHNWPSFAGAGIWAFFNSLK
jgi:poly(3-hydroxybutyrate) depolymerase